jgi:hypothetical protein
MIGFAIDIEHTGSVLKVTVKCQKVNGNHDAAKSLFHGRISATNVNLVLPEIQDLSMVTLNSFFHIQNGHLAYAASINGGDGTCLVIRMKKE